MRIVGNPALYSDKPSPHEAWLRGAALDRAVKRTQPPLPDDKPWPRVERLSHKQMNEQDDARMLARARLVNTASLHKPPPTPAHTPPPTPAPPNV